VLHSLLVGCTCNSFNSIAKWVSRRSLKVDKEPYANAKEPNGSFYKRLYAFFGTQDFIIVCDGVPF